MEKVLIIVPLDVYQFKYPHLFDFIAEYKKKFDVEILLNPERGYLIEQYVDRIKKTFYKEKTLKEILQMVKFFMQLARRKKNHYEYVISVDNLSYIIACYFLKNKRHVLWSLDFVAIDNRSHENYFNRKIQNFTKKYLLKNKKLIIQSSTRLQFFLKSISVHGAAIGEIDAKFLPVSLVDISPAKNNGSKEFTTSGITLIQIGGINQWRSHSCDLIAEFQNIDKMKLILHGFISSEVIDFLINQKPIKVPILSNIDMPSDMIIKLLGNADIGFVSYVANDENFINIDWASGQVAEFSRAGLPIICHGNTTLNRFVAEQNIGLGIHTMGELADAIKKISLEYKAYSCRSRKLFEEKMNITKLLPIYFN